MAINAQRKSSQLHSTSSGFGGKAYDKGETLTHYRRSGARVIIGVCLCALLTTVPARAGQSGTAAAMQANTEESPNELFVTVGKSVIVNSALPIERVSVGLGDFATANAVSPVEVLVNGKAPGQTSLILWQQGGGKLFFDVTVQPSPYGNSMKSVLLRRELSRELPGQEISVDVQDNLVFLRGTVKDLTSADRAVAIASGFGKSVNLLYVAVPPPEPQILLKVKFASVDRSLSRQLGMNLFSTGATNTIGSVTTQQFSPPIISNSPTSSTTGGVTHNGVTVTLSNALNLLIFRPDLNLGATIEALEARNLLQVLAEPNVLAENGKQASFLAGGQFPYPVVQGGTIGGTTAVTIQFAQFGVLLNFIPTITPRGTIRLQVAPEVSSLDYANGVTISGFTVPGISVRNVNTEVELAEGQSFAIGGLLDNRDTENFEKIPFLGDIPIIGKFFQSKVTTKSNTELMVIVTPQIVRPIPAGQPVPLPKYPSPFLPPNSPSSMAQPSQNITGPVPVTPPAPSVPVETLIKSLQEKPLVVKTVSGGMTGAAAGGGMSMGASTPAGAAPYPTMTPAPTPPQ
jgi:pilus assembly protein CpaC